tara:strand:+ start:1800 stop:1991 length:192 start_codon:yes stop_codon:yes gene_type:complete
MSYNYQYLSNEDQISFVRARIKNEEERIFEMELSNGDGVHDTEIDQVKASIINLKTKLTELGG